jgi:3-deoxy-D-manno-octulosonate 8-phosphate phosphatase (KDO 8-P phosphatase)
MPIKRARHVSHAAWASIRLFAMDVDGVLTDGTIYVTSDKKESKGFSILDGLGIKRLQHAGISVAWISGRSSGATTARAHELHIQHLVQDRPDKLVVLQEIAAELKLAAGQCVYMGDDEIDIPAMLWAGVGASVPDAMPSALAAANYVTHRRGGHGAVREVCELILSARGVKSHGHTS